MPLRGGENPLTFVALDRDSELVGSDSIVVTSTAAPGEPEFLRGDVNVDASVDISDAVRILLHLFSGHSIPCADAADADDDEAINITDGAYLLGHLFVRGKAPPPPYEMPGVDPTGDGSLGCETGLEM